MYSQHGEDMLLVERFGKRRNGTFVEVGAFNGVTFSNTCLLERSYGWGGLLVEPNPRQAAAASQARPNSTVVHAAAVAPDQVGSIQLLILHGYEAQSTLGLTRHYRTRFQEGSGVPPIERRTVRAATLDLLLEEAIIDHIDFISIDVEGHEDGVLRGLSLGSRWHPQVVLIERCTATPSLFSVQFLFRAGYRYRRTIVINDWYEPDILLKRVGGLFALLVQCGPSMVRGAVRATLRRLGLLGTVRRWRSSLFTLGHRA